MRRIRLITEYKGSRYVGWQTQSNGLSVQQVIETELYKLTGEKTAIHASGRTDSGVHALAQVFHFDTESRIPADKFPYALNVSLPNDIRIVYGDEPKPDFHARFSVEKKHYRYMILNSPHASAMYNETMLHYHGKLDFDLMHNAAIDVCGEHDFAAFKAEGTKVATTVRTVFESQWTRYGDVLCYDICGSGFMYNMVRILVGTMIEIGQHRLEENAIKHALAYPIRDNAGATAPAHGLTLVRVEYDDGFDTDDHIVNIRLLGRESQ